MRVVLFDLGGVLVRLGGVEEFGALVGTSDEGEIWRLWLGSPAVRRYERGLCSREEFARTAVEEFGIGIPPEEFLARFLSWPKGLLPGAAELLGSVRADVHRAVLSNTNELHWNEQRDSSRIHQLFRVPAPRRRPPEAAGRLAPWSITSLRREWARACDVVGAPRVGLYVGLKHSFATDAALRGVSERALQAYLGHADVRSTRRYVRLADSALVHVLRPRDRRS